MVEIAWFKSGRRGDGLTGEFQAVMATHLVPACVPWQSPRSKPACSAPCSELRATAEYNSPSDPSPTVQVSGGVVITSGVGVSINCTGIDSACGTVGAAQPAKIFDNCDDGVLSGDVTCRAGASSKAALRIDFFMGPPSRCCELMPAMVGLL